MSIRDTQREIRKGNFVKGAVSSKTALTARPKGVAGGAGAVVGKYPKTVAAGGALTLVALGVGGTKAIEAKRTRPPAKAIGKRDLKEDTKALTDKVSTEDKASLAIGGGAGAALMPMRQPKARGQRKYALNQMWEQAERAGTGDKADIKISPTTLGNVAEHKGNRAHNAGYTASMAQNAKFAPDKRYEADLYRDSKGRVSLRQTNGRHFAEVQNMLDKDIPTKVRLIEGEAPEEASAIKALYRYGKSRKERTALKEERGLDPAKVSSRAATYEGKWGKPARDINRAAQRVMHHEEVPIKQAKPNLHGRQAAFVGGGAGAMYVGNKVLRGEKKGPTKAITDTSTKISDTTRNKVAAVVAPTERKEITKGIPKGLQRIAPPPEEAEYLARSKNLRGLYMERRATANRAGKMAEKHIKLSVRPQSEPALQSQHALLAGHLIEAGDEAKGNAKVLARVIKPNNVVTKRDNRDRYAAGAGGAAIGAAVMPVRESAGGPGKAFAEKYKHLPSGVHQISSEDALKIAAPGVRRGNKDYTTRMAADIQRGSFKPEQGRIQITDDGARFTGGQHRAVGRAWAQEPNQTVEIVRSKGHMGATAPGIVAAGKRAKRVLAPAWYQRNNPGSTKELLERDAGAKQKNIDRALSGATPDKAKLDPVLTDEGLKKLKNKQVALVAGGAGSALVANELRRKGDSYIGKASPRPDYIAKKRAPGTPSAFLHPIKRVKHGVNAGIASAAHTAGQNAAHGAVAGVKSNIPAAASNIPDALKGAKVGGSLAGAGLIGAGLLAGAAKIGGDVVANNAAKKAALESTKRAKMYTAGGVGGAGLIGGGLALNRRKQ